MGHLILALCYIIFATFIVGVTLIYRFLCIAKFAKLTCRKISGNEVDCKKGKVRKH